MPTARKKSTTTLKARSAAKPVASKRVAVRGSERVQVLTFSKPKKRVTVKSKSSKESTLKAEPRPAVLISVSVDDGPAKVARYAGLFFMLVGACFASYSLSGLYVEMVQLSTSNQMASVARHQAAAIISSDTSTTNPTTTQTTTMPTQPVLAPTPSTDTVTAPTNTTSPAVAAPTEASHTTSTPSTTVPPREETQPAPLVIEPPIKMVVQGSDHLEGVSPLGVRVQAAERVELVLVPRTSLIERYLGRAVRNESDAWSFLFDTRQVPNGEYRLFARVTNKYGSYRSEPTLLRIFNPVPQAATGSTTAAKEAEVITTTITSTTLDLAKREPVQNVATEIKTFIAPRPAPEVAPTEELRTSTSSQQQVAASTTPVRENPVDPQIDVKALRFIESFDTDFKELLDLYGVALRADDKAGIQRIQERIMELRRQSLDRVETEIVKEDTPAEFAQQVRDRISTLMQTAQERREKEERLIQDRVGEKIKRDSDRDGVADYDEVHQYYTDPFVADSDADGFSDGAEILSGYDPKSEVREAAVAFEDPRKAGALREDILKIERLDVLAFSQPATSTEPQEEKVIFSGMALPNSFVTLYIFSTPIVVTVKTHDDGSWNYAFDKELEEGQHEIFVGMTDNAGKLIAKSTAFPFIKTANAYSIGRVSDQPMAVPAPAQSLFSENALVLTMSLVVMLVGLVLVLIGAHLAKHAKPHSVVAPVAAPV